MSQSYEDRILVYLIKMRPGIRIRIKDISTDPKAFVSNVKQLMDTYNWIMAAFSFSNDYKYIMRYPKVREDWKRCSVKQQAAVE